MPFDNEIILDDGKHLIIEVHGQQHYDIHFYKAKNKCSKEEAQELLHYQQVKDRYKKIYAIKNRYNYLELSWNMFDKKDTYKKLINDKIDEILNKNY